MKKLFSALLAALLLLNLAACGEKEPDDTPSGYDDSLISELYSEEGEYTDAENNTLAYSYHVPRIVSETAVAAALNDEIADQFGALVQEQKNMMASRVSLTCLSVTWTSYWNDSLLCLVVRAEMDGDTSMTETYSYDFFGGKRLMSEDLLARCELSTQDFITAANINAEMRLYLDGGALHMIVPVGSFAGAESYDADLALDLSARETVEKTAQDSFVKAALSGGDLTVSFEKTADSAWYAENFRFDYETIYPVEGLYSDYTDVFVGSVGQGYFPYIFLLTSEGTVEYVNLLEGLTAGFLCDGGPLGGVKGIVSFESGEVEEDYGTYQTVFAVDASGEKHDLSGAVSDADYTIPSEFLGEWTATVTHDTAEQGSYDSDYILTLTDGGGLTVQDINSEVGIYFEYTGQLNYLGTNGEGMVFGYHLNENAGTVHYGAFTLLRGSDGLHVKSVAGENFFDAPSGRYTVFARG